MTFRQMELFIAVCEHNNITKTSELMYISQQGVSKMIRDLEDELGCTLLHRRKNGVMPTEKGMFFLTECRSIIEKQNFICSNLATLEEFPTEKIQIGMAFGMISFLPHDLLQNFEKEYPKVKINYNDSTDVYLETFLKKGQFDFCITTGVFDVKSVITEKLLSEKVYLCIPKTHELYSKTEISINDLEDKPFAMFSTQFHIRHKFEASCKKNGFKPLIEMSSNDFNSLKEFAKSKNLLFVVPEHTINDNDDFLRYYPFPDEDFHWEVYFAKRKGKILSENMEAFYKFIKHSIANRY